MDSELSSVMGASSNPAHFPGRTLGFQKCLSSTQTMKLILDGELRKLKVMSVSFASHHDPKANK